MGTGCPEIVAVYNHRGVYRLKAFEHDGALKWANVTDGGNAGQFTRESGAIARHDLDADGYAIRPHKTSPSPLARHASSSHGLVGSHGYLAKCNRSSPLPGIAPVMV